MVDLKKQYKEEVRAELKKKFNITNEMAVPKIEKIIVNSGIGSAYSKDSKVVGEITDIIAQITGQAPVVTNAKISVSNFKLREGMPNGVKVTLRNEKMWDFLSKLIHITLPRVKDFRGIFEKAFDRKGNYTLGIKEHTIFPEIDTSIMSKIRPLQVVIVTSAPNDEQAYELLAGLGMPFKNKDRK